MPRMSKQERLAFLEEPGVLMRVATVDELGAPHVTPIWFLYRQGKIYFTPRQESAWWQYLQRDPRVALSIDEQPLPYRKIVIEGQVEIAHREGEDDQWRDLYLDLARRYVPEPAAEAYVQATIDQPRALLAVDLAEARSRSWRMPTEGEPQRGIWHRRYYLPGSRLGAD